MRVDNRPQIFLLDEHGEHISLDRNIANTNSQWRIANSGQHKRIVILNICKCTDDILNDPKSISSANNYCRDCKL